MTDQANKLEPCPFCGSEAESRQYDGEHFVQCLQCFNSTSADHQTEASAIAAWNRRAALPVSAPSAGSAPSSLSIVELARFHAIDHEHWSPERVEAFAADVLAKYGSPARWIPVSERLPESGDQVWISTTFSGVIAAKKEWRQGWAPDYWETAIGDLDMSDVTHWKPYFPPPPPQEGQ